MFSGGLCFGFFFWLFFFICLVDLLCLFVRLFDLLSLVGWFVSVGCCLCLFFGLYEALFVKLQ